MLGCLLRSCVHVSGLLHALVAMTSHKNPPSDAPGDEYDGDDEESVPVTSCFCQWKVPRQHKDKALKVTDAHFKKHVYGKSPKQKATELKDFDHRPQQYHGNAVQQLPALLASVRGRVFVCLFFLMKIHVFLVQKAANPLKHMTYSIAR